MKKWSSKSDEGSEKKFDGSKSVATKKRKNMMRLGGAGLSLQAFANAKSTSNNQYNPALIKKQREFYKNAKYISKFKRTVKPQGQQNGMLSAVRSIEEENETERKENRKDKRNKKKGSHNLRELYEKKHEEEEKARVEKEAYLKAKKEEQGKAEARRKAAREKMLKKTRHGQPVMKYRIEHLLQSIQGSKSSKSH